MKATPLPFLYEPLSSLLHLGGAVVALALLPLLLARVRQPWPRVLAYGSFGLSAVALLAVSGAYHATTLGTVERALLQRVDHAVIFMLIAGTYTPVVMDHFGGRLRSILLGLVWGAAVGGATIKVALFDSIGVWLGLSGYLTLGWAALLGSAVLARLTGFRALLPLVWGGVAYSVGGLVDSLEWPVIYEGVLGPHELFHMGVLLGLAIHGGFLLKKAHQVDPRLVITRLWPLPERLPPPG